MSHIAGSIVTLRNQINSYSPHRSTLSDGIIGDARHLADGNASDHNPWWINPNSHDGVYRAFDITHDPTNFCDGHVISDALVISHDPRIQYIIWNRHILDTRRQFNPYVWEPYDGDPHTSHVHLSVVDNLNCESTALWALNIFDKHMNPPAAVGTLSRGAQGPAVAELQRVLAAWYPTLHLVVDGIYGPQTEGAVRYLQTRAHLVVDGIAGPLTKAALHM